MVRKVLVAALLVGLAGPALAAQAGWERELDEMGYLIVHMSNINVINGLNLTREQAVKLRALALQVEAAADPPPTFRAPLSPGIEGVRKTYLEARQTLLSGQGVPPELHTRVGQARATETKFVRATLRPSPVGQGTQCTNCHAAPRSDSDAEPMSPSPAMRKVMGLAHMEGVYGKRGITKLLSVSSQAEAILTDAQKSILGSFSCCLVPPQDLSDPVRAGQAETSEKSLELVRNVRRIPEAAWPVARERILQRADEITQIVSAGATAEKKSAVRERVGKAIDRARSLSDVEFEVEKNELARAVKIAVQPPQGDAPHKAAYFLLVPGASKVYAQYLQRLAKQDKAAAQTQ